MGVGNLSPVGTRYRFEEIVTHKQQHISETKISNDRMIAEENEDLIIRTMCREFGFNRVKDPDWIHNRGIDEKVVAETRHGVELRIKYHPRGSKYFFLVVTSGEFSQENLATKHLKTYNNRLRKLLDDVYGEVRRKTGAWTSEKVTV